MGVQLNSQISFQIRLMPGPYQLKIAWLCQDRSSQCYGHYRPYALTSRLPNNDAMLGVKTCRAARTCCAGRAHWRSASQSVRGPGPARRYGMQVGPLAACLAIVHVAVPRLTPQRAGAPFCGRHMHMVYWLVRTSFHPGKYVRLEHYICVQALLEAYCTVPCRATTPHVVPGWFVLQAFKLFYGKCTKAYLHGTHSVRFAPNGAPYRLAFRRPSRYW